MAAACCTLPRQLTRPTTTAARIQRRRFSVHQWKSFLRWQDLDRDYKVESDEQARIKNTIKLGNDFYLSPEKIEDG